MYRTAVVFVILATVGAQVPALAATHNQVLAPDFNVTPLMAGDIDLYLAVMRTAVQRLGSVSGEQREARDLIKAMNTETPKPPWSSRSTYLVNFGRHQIATIDEEVAEQRGIGARYRAIRWGIKSRLVPSNGYCGRGGDCGASPTRLQIALMAREKAARAADKDLIEARRAEIEALIRQFAGMTDVQWR